MPSNFSPELKTAIAAFVVYTVWFIVDKIDHKAGNVAAVMVILSSIMFNREALAEEFRRLGVI